MAVEECLQRLNAKIAQDLYPMTNRDYQRVIRKYLIQYFGNHNLGNIEHKLVRDFEVWRNQQIGHAPIASILSTHSASFNRVI